MLGPGAFGRAGSLDAHVAGLRRRGIAAIAIELPRGRAERAAPAFAPYAGAVAGGHSFGGRAASLAALETAFRGLLLFGYPLAGRAAERTAHFEAITCPVLMLSGDADPLAPPAELEAAARRLRAGRLVLIPGGGHRLGRRLEAALDEAAAFVRSLSG